MYANNFMIPDSNPKIVIHAPLCRTTWGKLYYFFRSLDPSGSGQVTCTRGELLSFFGIDNSTLYRWLRDGRAIGAFRHYSRDQEQFLVCLGSKSVITLNLGLPNWGAATVIVRSDLAQPNFLNQVTAQQTYWLQRRSGNAALGGAKAERIKKPNLAKVDLSRATAQPTLQFFRNKVPHGASQLGIGNTLNINERTVRRHLKPVRRVQQVHKISYDRAWAHIQIAGETGKKPNCFFRGDEAYKYGCNIYDFNFEQRSEKRQRLKYMFYLCKTLRRLRMIDSKDNLSIDRIHELWKKSSFGKKFDLDDFVDLKSFLDFELEIKEIKKIHKADRRRERLCK
jgi:hypothetical protein